jgi:hypothetical protein
MYNSFPHLLSSAQLKAEFSTELAEIQDEFLSERKLIVEQYEREINEIKDIQFAMTVGAPCVCVLLRRAGLQCSQATN